MVSSTTVTDNDTKENTTKRCIMGIEPGDYRLVGWDMDTTGKKVIDEICQIATYTPTSSYSQYVMPYRDLNPTAIKRHSMKVVTNGKFRVLRHSKTNEVIKSKSEVSALIDFLSWLESVKEAADGIILVYHEPRKVIPAMLLESLEKYDLLDRFKQSVKGFANGFSIAEEKYATTAHIFSLRTLSRTLLNKEGNLGNAQDRASLALQIMQHLSLAESKIGGTCGSGDTDTAMKKTAEFIREYAQPVAIEEQEHDKLKDIFQRQNNLRPIFSALFRMNRRERQHASPLRRLLAEAGIEYFELQEAWTEDKRTGLEQLVKEKLPKVDEKKIEDLLIILERHFDPEKKPKNNSNTTSSNSKTPSDRKGGVKAMKNQKINDDKENNNKCDSGIDTTVDTTTTTTITAAAATTLTTSTTSTTTTTTTTSASSVKLTSQDVEIKTVGYA